jgi:hypothetical protein
LDDGHKPPDGLAATHPAMQRIENIFEPIIHVMDLKRARAGPGPKWN